jgi:hypothetical protein
MANYWIANVGTSEDPLPADSYGAPAAVERRKQWGPT